MSGMRLHVTSELRAHDIGNVQIGQNAIAIPADTNKYVISGECPSSCTRVMLPRPIYITEIYLHMHGLGTVSCVFCLHNIITRLYSYGDFLWCFLFCIYYLCSLYGMIFYMVSLCKLQNWSRSSCKQKRIQKFSKPILPQCIILFAMALFSVCLGFTNEIQFIHK